MSKRKRRKHRWDHPYRKHCYCYKRQESGYIFTSVFGHRESTDYKWKDENKDTALQILEQRAREYLNPSERSAAITVEDICIEYSKLHYPNYSYDIKSRYNRSVQYFLTENLQADNIDGIRNNILLNLNSMRDEYSAPYIYKLLQCLRKIFDFAVEENLISRNPVKKAMFPDSGRKARKLFFTTEELDKLIKHSREKRGEEFAYLLEFLKITGPRISEALTLQKKHIDFDMMQVMIRDTKRADKSIGEKFTPRYLDIDVFNKYTDFEKLLRRLLSINKDSEYVFRWNSYSRIEKWLREDMKDIDIYIPMRSFHAIRKYAENQFILQGYPISLGSRVFGHDEATMKKNYLEVLGPKKLKEVTQNLMKNL